MNFNLSSQAVVLVIFLFMLVKGDLETIEKPADKPTLGMELRPVVPLPPVPIFQMDSQQPGPSTAPDLPPKLHLPRGPSYHFPPVSDPEYTPFRQSDPGYQEYAQLDRGKGRPTSRAVSSRPASYAIPDEHTYMSLIREGETASNGSEHYCPLLPRTDTQEPRV